MVRRFDISIEYSRTVLVLWNQWRLPDEKQLHCLFQGKLPADFISGKAPLSLHTQPPNTISGKHQADTRPITVTSWKRPLSPITARLPWRQSTQKCPRLTSTPPPAFGAHRTFWGPRPHSGGGTSAGGGWHCDRGPKFSFFFRLVNSDQRCKFFSFLNSYLILNQIPLIPKCCQKNVPKTFGVPKLAN